MISIINKGNYQNNSGVDTIDKLRAEDTEQIIYFGLREERDVAQYSTLNSAVYLRDKLLKEGFKDNIEEITYNMCATISGRYVFMSLNKNDYPENFSSSLDFIPSFFMNLWYEYVQAYGQTGDDGTWVSVCMDPGWPVAAIKYFDISEKNFGIFMFIPYTINKDILKRGIPNFSEEQFQARLRGILLDAKIHR